MLHLGDGDVQALGGKPVAHLGDPPHLLQHPPGHGGGAAGPLYPEQVVHVVQVGGASDQIAAVGLLPENLDHLVVTQRGHKEAEQV